MSNRLAAIGLVIALIAVGMAAFRNNHLYPPPATRIAEDDLEGSRG